MARARKAPARKTTARRRTAKRQPKRILNCEPSPQQEADWTFEHAADADVVDAAPPIPASKDLRAAWWTVADQGTTGSCVGWATADSVLRWHFVQAKKLPQNTRLSPRFDVHLNRRVPAGDGGIALGQAVVAAAIAKGR